ncbi:MAG: preprotein translocase subunit SecG [Bacteroides sp.]
MYLLLIILMVIVSLLMCGIVLIQNSKGGGLASGFASSNQIMGVRKTTDFLEKTTWTLAACMVVFSVVSAYTLSGSASQEGGVILEQAQQEEKTNPYSLPAGTAAPATDSAAEVPATDGSASDASASDGK